MLDKLPVAAPQTAPVVYHPHPFASETVPVTMSAGMTLLDMVNAVGVAPEFRAMIRVWVDDVEIPRDQWAFTRPRAGRYVYIKTTPGKSGKNILASVLMLLVVVGAAFFAPMIAAGLGLTGTALTVGTSLIGGALTMLGALAVNALIPPPSNGDGLVGQMALLSGVRNQMRPYADIPRIFGKRRVYPLLAARPYTEASGKNRYLRVLLCVGWGPLRISQIKVGDTPISAFEAITYQVREGWTDNKFGSLPSGKTADTNQTLFTKQVLEENFNILLAPNTEEAGHDVAGPWETRRTETDVSEISVDVAFPYGLVKYDDDGDRKKATVTVDVQYRKVGDATWIDVEWSGNDEDDGTQTDGQIIGKDNSATPVFRGGRWIAPEEAQYDVRMRRVTEKRGSNYADRVEWVVLRSIKRENPLKLKGLALIALRLKATDQLNGLPDTINCVAESYLPAWNGSSWTYEISRNPAWAYVDVMRRRGTDRVLAENRIDRTTIQSWATACEVNAPNSSENRWNFDGIFEGGSILTALQQIGAHGRGAFTVRDGKYSVVRDIPQTVPVQIITPRNSWGYAGSKAFMDLPHALRVSYINAENGYQDDEIIVYADGYSKANATRFERLDLPACTSPTMAWREGRYHLAVGQLRPEEHVVNMDIEALRCNAGDLVHLAHDVLSIGLSSGRITDRIIGRNLLRQTENLNHAVFSKFSTSASSVTPPAGYVSAWRLARTTAASNAYTQQNISGAPTAAIYSASFLVKRGTTDALFGLRIQGSYPRRGDALFDLQSQTVVVANGGSNTNTSASISEAGDGWFLCAITTTFVLPESAVISVVFGPARLGSSVSGWEAAGTICDIDVAAPELEIGQIGPYQGNPTSTVIAGLVIGYDLDETIQLDPGQSYALRTRRSPGGIALEPLASVSEQTVTNEVALATAIAAGDAADEGDLFVFGEADRVTAPMLVKKIEPGGELTARLTLVDAQQGVHSADTGEIPAFETYASTQTPYEQQLPAAPTFTLQSDETMVERQADGTLVDRIGVLIRPFPSGDVEVAGVAVEYREFESGGWISAGTVDADTRVVHIGGVRQGVQYEVRARSVARAGVASLWVVSAPHTVIGKTTVPVNVTGLTAVGRVDGVQLNWTLNAEIDVAGYEVRRGAVWDTATVVARLTDGPSLFASVSVAQSQTFMVRAVDVLGLKSTAAASATAAVVAPADVARFDAYPQGENIRFVWAQVAGQGVDYEIRCGDEWATAQRVARVTGDTVTLAWPVTSADTVRFWIKAVSLAGLFSGTARFVNVPRVPAQNRNVVLVEDFGDADWSDVENIVTDLELVTVGGSEVWLQTATDGAGLTRARGELCRVAPLIDIASTRSWLDVAAAGSAASVAWEDAEFSWDDAAGMTWLGAEVNDEDVTVTTFIALSGAGLPVNTVEAWRFNAATVGENGTVLAQSIAEVYGPCHFSRGLDVSGFMHATGGGPRYLVSVPAEFSAVFDIKLKADYSAGASYVVAQLDNNGSGGAYLRLVHDGATGKFRLEGSAGAALEIEALTSAGEMITLGISQSATQRSLFVKRWRDDAVLAEQAAIAPIGTFGTLAFYDTRGVGGTFLASAKAVLGDTAIFSVAQTEADFTAYVTDQTPLGFSAWREFVPGEYNVERAAIRIRCDIANPLVKATIVSAVLNMDVPDVVERRSVSVSPGGTAVTFDKTFNAVPTVVAVQSGGATVAIVVTESVTTTGFTVKLHQATSPATTVAGEISFTATGY